MHVFQLATGSEITYFVFDGSGMSAIWVGPSLREAYEYTQSHPSPKGDYKTTIERQRCYTNDGKLQCVRTHIWRVVGKDLQLAKAPLHQKRKGYLDYWMSLPKRPAYPEGTPLYLEVMDSFQLLSRIGANQAASIMLHEGLKLVETQRKREARSQKCTKCFKAASRLVGVFTPLVKDLHGLIASLVAKVSKGHPRLP